MLLIVVQPGFGCISNAALSQYCEKVIHFVCYLRRDFDRPNTFAARFSSVHFGRMRGQNHVRFTLVQYGIC